MGHPSRCEPSTMGWSDPETIDSSDESGAPASGRVTRDTTNATTRTPAGTQAAPTREPAFAPRCERYVAAGSLGSGAWRT
jgi:hypothetical protein